MPIDSGGAFAASTTLSPSAGISLADMLGKIATGAPAAASDHGCRPCCWLMTLSSASLGSKPTLLMRGSSARRPGASAMAAHPSAGAQELRDALAQKTQEVREQTQRALKAEEEQRRCRELLSTRLRELDEAADESASSKASATRGKIASKFNDALAACREQLRHGLEEEKQQARKRAQSERNALQSLAYRTADALEHLEASSEDRARASKERALARAVDAGEREQAACRRYEASAEKYWSAQKEFERLEEDLVSVRRRVQQEEERSEAMAREERSREDQYERLRKRREEGKFRRLHLQRDARRLRNRLAYKNHP